MWVKVEDCGLIVPIGTVSDGAFYFNISNRFSNLCVNCPCQGQAPSNIFHLLLLR